MRKIKSTSKLLRFAEPKAEHSSILTKMFQKMLFAVNAATPKEINGQMVNEATQKWDKLVIDYLNDSRNSIPQNEKDRYSARGNLQKEIVANPSMSWKVFCKAMRLINVVRFDFIIVAKFGSGNLEGEKVFKETIHIGERVPYPQPLPVEKNGDIPYGKLLKEKKPNNE